MTGKAAHKGSNSRSTDDLSKQRAGASQRNQPVVEIASRSTQRSAVAAGKRPARSESPEQPPAKKTKEQADTDDSNDSDAVADDLLPKNRPTASKTAPQVTFSQAAVNSDDDTQWDRPATNPRGKAPARASQAKRVPTVASQSKKKMASKKSVLPEESEESESESEDETGSFATQTTQTQSTRQARSQTQRRNGSASQSQSQARKGPAHSQASTRYQDESRSQGGSRSQNDAPSRASQRQPAIPEEDELDQLRSTSPSLSPDPAGPSKASKTIGRTGGKTVQKTIVPSKTTQRSAAAKAPASKRIPGRPTYGGKAAKRITAGKKQRRAQSSSENDDSESDSSSGILGPMSVRRTTKRKWTDDRGKKADADLPVEDLESDTQSKNFPSVKSASRD